MELDIQALAGAISAQIVPPVPVSAAFWSKREIAACLNCGRTTVNNLIKLPDFPPSYRFPTSGDGGQPRWKAVDVVAWAEKYRVNDVSI